MKIKVKNFQNLQKVRSEIKNALSTEKSKDLKDALTTLLDELDESEVEIDEKVLSEKVSELLSSYMKDPEAEVPAAVTDMIAKKIQAVQNSVQAQSGNVVSKKVQNEIASAIISGKTDKHSIKNAVDDILVKNDITGLSFGSVIDFAIATKWEELNPLFTQFKRVFYNKFFYTTDEMISKEILAKQWDKTAVTEKVIQDIVAVGKDITTKYIYKRQQMNLEDLDEIEIAGESSNFLAWVSNELDSMIVNSIVIAILVGDTTNEVADRITTFETIGTKAATDAFTYVQNPAVALTVTVSDIRTMCDRIHNPNGKAKVLVIEQSLLTALSEYTYATGGDTHYRSNEEMAKQFGVASLYVTDVLASLSGVHAICLIPDGYWYNEKKSLSFAWPTIEKNKLNYMKERNCGGAIHDLLSTAVLKEA